MKKSVILACVISLLSVQYAQAQAPSMTEVNERIKKAKELTAKAAATNRGQRPAGSPEQQESDALTQMNQANKTGFAMTRSRNYAGALPFFTQAADIILSEKFKQSRDPDKNPNVNQVVANLDTVIAHAYQSGDWLTAENAARKKVEVFEAAQRTDSKDYQSTLKQLQVILMIANKSTGNIPEKLEKLGAAPH